MKKYSLEVIPFGSQVQEWAEKQRDSEKLVPVHSATCNDYTGCNSECGWARKVDTEYLMGANRRV